MKALHRGRSLDSHTSIGHNQAVTGRKRALPEPGLQMQIAHKVMAERRDALRALAGHGDVFEQSELAEARARLKGGTSQWREAQ